MRFQFPATPLYLALLLAAALAAPVQATTPASPATAGTLSPPETPPKPAKAKKKSTKTNTVKYEKGSAESTSERDRRLYRECKGRPNAGACMGYAS